MELSRHEDGTVDLIAVIDQIDANFKLKDLGYTLDAISYVIHNVVGITAEAKLILIEGIIDLNGVHNS